MLLEKAHSLNLYKSQVITYCDEKQVNTKLSRGGPLVGQDQRNSVLCPSEWAGLKGSTISLTELEKVFFSHILLTLSVLAPFNKKVCLGNTFYIHSSTGFWFDTGKVSLVAWLAWSFLCRSGWPQTCSDPLASASQVLGLLCAPTTRVCFVFVWGIWALMT